MMGASRTSLLLCGQGSDIRSRQSNIRNNGE